MAQFKNTIISDNGSLEIPTGNSSQRPISPEAGMMRYNTDIADIEYYDGTNWVPIGDSNSEATGGTIVDTNIGGVPYRIHLFTNVGNTNFTVTKGGEVEYLIIAGGGAGGGNLSGGGGAGGVLTGFTTLTPQTYTITVGAGGARFNSGQSGGTSNSGGNSSAFGLTAIGGGAGGGGSSGINATTGGSAGGGGGYVARAAIAGTSGQGNAGGKGSTSAQNYRAGGGGGAGQPGGDWENSEGRGGYGGAGIVSFIEGRNIWYAGGGGGGSYHANKGGGHGGLGGGGGAGTNSTSGGRGGRGRTDGKDGIPLATAQAIATDLVRGGDAGPNTGSGGGGVGHQTAQSGAGGSGIVVVRYRRNRSSESNIAPNVIVKSSLPSIQEFSMESPAPSARVITDLGLGNGWYWVDLAGPKWVYVNTQFDGGGWYLIIQNNAGNGGIGTINYVDAIDFRQFYRTTPGVDPREPGVGYSNDFKEFNLWTGMKLWEEMTGGSGTGGQIAQVVHDKPTALDSFYTKRATWTYTGFGPRYEFQGAANINSTSNNPGLYGYHAVNGYALTTHDRDQDAYGSNCANLYGGHPMWFGACWSGNVWGSTSGSHADAYHWDSSGGDNFNYGAVYVRAL